MRRKIKNRNTPTNGTEDANSKEECCTDCYKYTPYMQRSREKLEHVKEDRRKIQVKLWR